MQSAALRNLVPCSKAAVARLGECPLTRGQAPALLLAQPAAAVSRQTGHLHRPVYNYLHNKSPAGWCRQQQRRPHCDVFINHRGADTKRTVASLLYDRLVQLNVRPFLDNRSMEPGDKLFETINSAILDCKVGIAIFSPRYCESFFCLHELALMVESRKKVIPIFCDVNPSDLLELKDGDFPPEDLRRFQLALRDVKYTVGLTFDSQNGNWSDLVSKTSEIVVKSIKEGAPGPD